MTDRAAAKQGRPPAPRYRQWLRQQRLMRCWSGAQMARQLHQAATSAGHKLPGHDTLLVMIYRWEDNRSKFCLSRNDKWVFGDRETGVYLLKHDWTRPRPHILVRGTASPDDPDLTGYWRYRRRKHGTPLDSTTTYLLSRQQGRCPLCGDRLLDTSHLPASPEEWENLWLGVTRQHTGRAPSTPVTRQQPGTQRTTLRLIHASCHRTAVRRAGAQHFNPQHPSGSPEPDAGTLWHVRFLGGRGATMRPGYPTGGSRRRRSSPVTPSRPASCMPG